MDKVILRIVRSVALVALGLLFAHDIGSILRVLLYAALISVYGIVRYEEGKASGD